MVVFGCGTISSSVKLYVACVTLVAALSEPPPPQFVPAVNLRTLKLKSVKDSWTK